MRCLKCNESIGGGVHYCTGQVGQPELQRKMVFLEKTCELCLKEITWDEDSLFIDVSKKTVRHVDCQKKYEEEVDKLEKILDEVFKLPEPLKTKKEKLSLRPFWMVYLDGRANPVMIHRSQPEAVAEARRLALKENRRAFVLEAIVVAEPSRKVSVAVMPLRHERAIKTEVDRSIDLSKAPWAGT